MKLDNTRMLLGFLAAISLSECSCFFLPSIRSLPSLQQSQIASFQGLPVTFLSSSDETESGFEESSQGTAALARSYEVLSGLFLALFFAILFMPLRSTMITRLPSKVGGAAGFGLASGVSRILANATTASLLKQETYKRLNVGLLLFNAIGLVAIPAEAAFHPNFAGALVISASMQLAKLVGCVISYWGWKIGCGVTANKLAPKEMMNELYKGTRTTFASLRSKNGKGEVYRVLLWLILVGLAATIQETFRMMDRRRIGRPNYNSSLQWSALSRLYLIVTMVFTLKDMAEKEQTNNRAFVQLNFLLAAWAFLVGVGMGFYRGGFSLQKWTDIGLFSIPFFYQGVKSLRQQDKETEEG